MINLIHTIICILCLCIGYFFGLKIGKMLTDTNKEIEPNVKVEKAKTRKLTPEEQKSIEHYETIWNNINDYTGDSKGQREVNG